MTLKEEFFRPGSKEIGLPKRPEDLIPVVQEQSNCVHVLLGDKSVVLKNEAVSKKLIADLIKAHEAVKWEG